MSVLTEADECLQRVKDGLEDSIRQLSKIVVEECSGADEFKPETRLQFLQGLVTLIQLREELFPH